MHRIDPATPAPRHEGMFATEGVKLPLNFNRIGSRPPRGSSG